MVSIPEPAHLRALADRCDEMRGNVDNATVGQLNELWHECNRFRCWCDRSVGGVYYSVITSLIATANELRTYANDIEASR